MYKRQWETGRLTPRTKEEALYCLSLYQETVEQRLTAGPNERLSDMLQFFRETQEMLLSPLPEAKKISKPYARKCPWREEMCIRDSHRPQHLRSGHCFQSAERL